MLERTPRLLAMRALCGVFCGLSLVIAALAWSSRAEAHGGLPRAFEILVEPGNADDVVLRSDLWGFFRTRDAGKTWQWTCAEAYGADSLSVNHQHFAIATGGRLIVANWFKGVRYTDDGCQWLEASDISGKLAVDVQITEGGVFVLTSTNDGGDGGLSGLLLQSQDGGDHYRVVGGALPRDFAAAALVFAPSDRKRVYVSGRTLSGTVSVVQRSDDGGSTWHGFPLPTTSELSTLRVAGVHPSRPDVLFVWADLAEDYMQNAPDEIWATADGGSTWSEIYAGSGDLPGFAFSPDGTEIMIAGPLAGLQRARLNEALVSGQTAFVQAFTTPARPNPGDRQVWGLRWDSTGLTGGTDNFTRQGVPAFTYGIWTEPKAAFDELMSICDATLAGCGESSTVGLACPSVYDNPQGGFLQDFLQSTRCLGAGGAGASASGGGKSSGGAPQSGAGGTAGVGGGAGTRIADAGPSSRAARAGAAATAASKGCGCAVIASRAPNERRAFLFSLLVALLARRPKKVR